MRADPRYYYTTTGKVEGSSRFEYEERQQSVGMSRRFWGNQYKQQQQQLLLLKNRGTIRRWDSDAAFHNNNHWSTASGSFASHPILQGLRDLYDLLSAVESTSEGSTASIDNHHQYHHPLNAVTFVSPFAAAVCSKDVDAKTTGAALSALHKFIVYGFVGGHFDVHWQSTAYYSSVGGIVGGQSALPSSDVIRESITVVAQCIRHCSFEESDSKNASGGSKGMLSFWSSDKSQQKRGTSMLDQNVESGEGVKRQLAICPFQVLRCPAGRNYLSPLDVVGVIDTCLHVAIAAGEAKRTLLRSAAADALSHCVIVVFGMRGGCSRNSGRGGSSPSRGRMLGDDDTGGPTTQDGSDSDDDWGERDPTEEDERVEGEARINEQRSVSDHEPSEKETTSTATQQLHEEEPALVSIMARLAALADPLIHEDDTCILALSLINIALETMSDVDSLAVNYPRLLSILQNDLCRNLLRLSTASDLTILGLSLRVIFNLFNGIKDHLKVQLEVFLTSVHLRILSSSESPTTHEQVWSSSPERRELALESLLEFCREPMLMQDLYINYDCDINCTNLFETICITLAKVANPDVDEADNGITGSSEEERGGTDEDIIGRPRLNILNRLALEGVIAVIDSIARRCRASSNLPQTPLSHREDDALLPSPPDTGNSAFLGNTLCIEMDGLESLQGSFDYDCNMSSSSDVTPEKRFNDAFMRSDSDMSDADMNYLSRTKHQESLVLRERKIKKRRLAKAAAMFNECSRDKEWLVEAERLGVITSPATADSVAHFLYHTPKLDKVKIGSYISKGPPERYPFIADVLKAFAGLFDFRGMSFSDALRVFLSRFRLPGEAQCIDRLMEAFAARLYDFQLSESGADTAVEDAMLAPLRNTSESELNSRTGCLDPPASDESDSIFPFKSADACFILAFSTIMLNTDLHNPNMDDAKRMTIDQFVRNNRGINDGEDLPTDFLKSLYYEINNEEIQVKQDTQDGLGKDGDFDGLLANAADVATPFYTSTNSAHNNYVSVHDRDMFISISSAAIEAVSTVYVHSWDDALVAKALDGLKNAANICVCFGLHQQFNEILQLLLSWGGDYVSSVATLIQSDPGVAGEVQTLAVNDPSTEKEDIGMELLSKNLPPLPASFVAKLNSKEALVESSYEASNNVAGSAAHRGLLSLDCALTLCKNHLSSINEALPALLDVVFALRDVDALPERLGDLDDFADSHGEPLPPSSFANSCREVVTKYKDSAASSSEQSSSPGFLSSIFFGKSPSGGGKEGVASKSFASPLQKVLQKVSKKASLDQIILKTNDVVLAKRVLSAMLMAMYPDEDADIFTADPLFEHNASFVLELAARLLISNRAHSSEMLPIFLSRFEALLSPQTNQSTGESEIIGLKHPYLVERIVEWDTIKHLLDLAAQAKSGRGFVFDGIASVVDYALPVKGEEDGEAEATSNDIELSADGAEVLASLLLKFLEGTYDDDLSYTVPAMMYIKRVYSYLQCKSKQLPSGTAIDSEEDTQLRGAEWEKMITIIYDDVCMARDPNTARKGFESLQEVLMSTQVESIPDERWFTLMKMVLMQPPDITLQVSRISSLSLIGRMFLTLMPVLSNRKENWSRLEDFTIAVATMASENLRSGRASPYLRRRFTRSPIFAT
eukprot:g11568.t1 g11568   contig6:110020-115493(-)